MRYDTGAKTTTIRPPTELPNDGPTTIDTGPLVTFIKEIARLNRRATSWTEFAVGGLATIIMDDEANKSAIRNAPSEIQGTRTKRFERPRMR
jgi:hypothetical protein